MSELINMQYCNRSDHVCGYIRAECCVLSPLSIWSETPLLIGQKHCIHCPFSSEIRITPLHFINSNGTAVNMSRLHLSRGRSLPRTITEKDGMLREGWEGREINKCASARGANSARGRGAAWVYVRWWKGLF